MPAVGLQIRNAEEILPPARLGRPWCVNSLGVAAEIQEIVGADGDAWSVAGLAPEERYASLARAEACDHGASRRSLAAFACGS